ncbi:MAG: hypothetical protein QXT68_05975 [Halobacteria archaeon]
MHPVLLRLAVLTFGVLAVSFLPIVVPGRKADLYSGMTLEDLLAIAVQGPFLAFALWWVFRALPVQAGSAAQPPHASPRDKPGEGRPFLLDLLLVSSLFLFFAGFGLHWAANSAHNTMDHIQGLPKIHNHSGPAPGFGLVYFYDEILGHKMTYLGFFGLLLAGCWLQLLADTGVLSRRQTVLLAAVSVAGGVGGAFSALEGQTPLEGIVLSGAAALGLILLMRRRKEAWARRPVVFYTVATSVLIVVMELVWLARFGGFYQPSELFAI